MECRDSLRERCGQINRQAVANCDANENDVQKEGEAEAERMQMHC
jgi:hypothetical protein